MAQQNLILTLPEGTLTATSLGIEGFARHRSPGSGRFFQHRTLLFDLPVASGRPDFQFNDQGGWRDAVGDTVAALEAVGTTGKRTKTALSCNAFSATPVSALRRGFLVKTGGEVLELQRGEDVLRFASHECDEHMTPDQVAQAVGRAPDGPRKPRLYMVLCPVQFLMMSNLTPVEYAWYATHRPGKIFRQVLFAELKGDQPQLAAESVFLHARQELSSDPVKKTKTIITEETINRVLYADWVGYEHEEGGLYVGDRNHVMVWRFPKSIPRDWDRVEG